jgi:hypothetical protein
VEFSRVLRWQLDEELAVRQSPVSTDINMEAEEATVLEAVTKSQLVKIQQTDKT